MLPPIPSPATVLTLSFVPGSYDDALQGALCTNNAANTCAAVPYSPLFFPSGVPALDAVINATPGQKVVFGYSQGAQVVQEYLAQRADDADAPSPDELSFVLIGNATRKYGGANVPAGKVLEDSQYQVIDVARQYDYAVDFPDDPSNLLALANALAGFGTIHLTYRDVDIYDPANTVWTEGNITYVFVPTKNLPLLEPLRWIGLNALADQMNGPLKEIIEQAYDRSYLTTPEPPPPTPTPSVEAPPVAVTTEPAVTPAPHAEVSVSAAKVPTTGPSAQITSSDDVVEETTGATPTANVDAPDEVKETQSPTVRVSVADTIATAPATSPPSSTESPTDRATDTKPAVPGEDGGPAATSNETTNDEPAAAASGTKTTNVAAPSGASTSQGDARGAGDSAN